MNEGIPLYIQVRNQIRMFILSGILAPGQKLPGVRQIADYLSINRHTISRAIQELESTGLIITKRGSGTRVTENLPVTQIHKQEMFTNLVQKSISETQSLGYTIDELIEAIIDISKGDVGEKSKKIRICFIECNQISLEHYTIDLTKELGVEIIPLLISQLGEIVSKEDNALTKCDLVVTTLGHMPEVKRILGKDIEIFPITVGPYLEIFFDVLKLPKDYSIGIVTASERGAIGMKQAMVQSGISPNRLFLASMDRPDLIKEALQKSNALVVSIAALEKVNSLKGDKQIKIIEYRNILDQGGLDALKQVILDKTLTKTTTFKAGEIGIADLKRALLEK